MAKEKTSPMIRTRNWTIVIYPESAPDNWRDLIEKEHIEWVESPLHDKDLDATGELKKPHWHILLMFGGVKTFEQVLEFVKPLNCPIPIKVHNTKSLVRYMAHLDNPDKAQYSRRDIIAHGGVELQDLLSPGAHERYEHINNMFDYIKDNHIVEVQDLIDYARFERSQDWFPLLCDNSLFIVSQYIKSQRHRGQQSSNVVNLDTGEITDLEDHNV